jgi:hypothetical protein
MRRKLMRMDAPPLPSAPAPRTTQDAQRTTPDRIFIPHPSSLIPPLVSPCYRPCRPSAFGSGHGEGGKEFRTLRGVCA